MFNLWIVSVCNAGHYGNEYSCTICPGNTIKSALGDTVECSGETPCDIVSTVPNSQHMACGMFT